MNKRRNDRLGAIRLFSITIWTVLAAASAQVLIASLAGAQTPNRPGVSRQRWGAKARSAFPWPLMPGTSDLTPAAGPNLPVLGGGTLGRLTKWTGFTSSNSVIGDATIFEDKFGNVGIGTDTPTSRLTVQGMIETTLGGYKFPDGTVQTTAALTGLTSVAHGSTLTGNGTTGSPLDVALPLKLDASVSGFPLVSIINPVEHGDGLFVSADGSGLTVEALGDGIVSSGGAARTGVRARGGFGDVGGAGLSAEGGGGNSGGAGISAVGGAAEALSGAGGLGVRAVGGAGKGNAGDGLIAQGGFGGNGGVGVRATGGDSGLVVGGFGLIAAGGDSGSSVGGFGAIVSGGTGAPGRSGGVGILAFGGSERGTSNTALAAELNGDVDIGGSLSKSSGSFKIDHPLDPENKYLYHSFVESPDMKNIYDGVVRLDPNGEAIVELPEWFGALNKDFRYLLTPIGAPSPMLYIAEEISDNRFKIAGGTPGMKVSWQVTGIRQDAYANAHRIKVEEDKPEPERGHYLHPELFNQPEELGVQWARHPELMREMKETRLKKIEEIKQKTRSNDR